VGSQYDEHNRMTLIRDALTNTARMFYDGVGNKTCETDANNHYTFYKYDELNRLVHEVKKIGTQECTPPDEDDIVTRNEYDVCPSCAGSTLFLLMTLTTEYFLFPDMAGKISDNKTSCK